MPSRLNNFQRILAANNPTFNINRPNSKTVNIYKKNSRNTFSRFKNHTNGNTLTINVAFSNNANRRLGYQTRFMAAAFAAAIKAGYSKLNAHSVYPALEPIGINKNNGLPAFPPSYYILKNKGFTLMHTKGNRGIGVNQNKTGVRTFKAYFVKNLPRRNNKRS